MPLPTRKEIESLPAFTKERPMKILVSACLAGGNGFRVVSQRDYRTLEYVHQKLDPSHSVDETALDHHEINWYRTYFSPKE